MISNKILFSSIFLLMCSTFIYCQSYQVLDIDCFDKDGEILSNAFAGGLNSPQFNEIDMNMDGTLDLLIFDREGNAIIPLIFKDNAYHYKPEYKNLFPKFKKWVRFRDYNDDGIMDIFCYNIEAPLDGVEIYTGSISGGSLSFSKYKTTQGFYEIIYYKFQNLDYNLEVSSNDIPEMVDVDSDGDLDIITFTGDEPTVRLYQNMCIENNISLDEPTFELVDLCWGKFKESSFDETITLSDNPNKCAENFKPEFEISNSRHAGSTITAYDDDNDGDYEVLIGDLTNEHIIWLFNGGDKEKAFMNDSDTEFPSYDKSIELYIFNSAFVLDIDKDGNEDLVVAPNTDGGGSNIENVLFYKNEASDGEHDFNFIKNNLFADEMLEFGSLTNPAICDFNQDGKKDILVGAFGEYRPGENPDGNMILLENISEDDDLQFKIVDEDYLGFKNFNNTYYSYAPTFGDLDGDGDDDLIVGTQNGTLIYCENSAGAGNPYSFLAPQFDYADIDIGDNAKPQLIDLNRDGLLDIVIGERNQNPNPFNDELIGNINYFQNQGTESSPMFDPEENNLPNTPTLGFVVTRVITESFNGSAAPYFLDTGEDFLLYTGSETGRVKLYDNIVDSIYGTFNLVDDEITAFKEGKRVTLAIDDLNDDGLYEFITGNQRGGIAIYGSDLKIDGSVNVQDLAEQSHFHISPNPSSGIFTIKGDFTKANNIQVINQFGQLIKTLDLNHQNSNEYKMQLNEIPNGIYFLKFNDSNRVVSVEKLIINR